LIYFYFATLLARTRIMDEDWVAHTQKKIQAAFLLFDKEKKGVIVQEEVPTIMRYLGAYPTEQVSSFFSLTVLPSCY